MLKPQISWACSLRGNGSQTADDSYFLWRSKRGTTWCRNCYQPFKALAWAAPSTSSADGSRGCLALTGFSPKRERERQEEKREELTFIKCPSWARSGPISHLTYTVSCNCTHTVRQTLDAPCYTVHLLIHCLFPSLNNKLQEGKDFIWFMAVCPVSRTRT